MPLAGLCLERFIMGRRYFLLFGKSFELKDDYEVLAGPGALAIYSGTKTSCFIRDFNPPLSFGFLDSIDSLETKTNSYNNLRSHLGLIY